MVGDATTEEGSGLGQRRRWALGAVLVLPASIALVTSVGLAISGHSGRELTCWVLPNARVFVVPGDAACPLPLHAQIRIFKDSEGRSWAVSASNSLSNVLAGAGSRISVAVASTYGEQWREVTVREPTTAALLSRILVAGIAALALVAIPLSLLWGSRSSAAEPLVFLYGPIAMITVTALCGRGSDWLTRGSLLAMTVVPAALAHLSFVFPSERKLVREAPEIVRLPYGLCLLLMPAGWFALERDALLWPSFMYLILALTAGGWLILVLSCFFAIRESASDVERARARTLCYGALILPILPTALLARNASSTGETLTAYLWSAAVVNPLPIGLAISRYNLFNLTWDLRRWIGKAIFIGTASAVTYVIFETALALTDAPDALRDPSGLFLASMACVTAIELLRWRTEGVLEAVLSPRISRLRRLRLAYERAILRLEEEDRVARTLGEALQSALEPARGCVFLCHDGDWRPVFPFGKDPPSQVSLIEDALRLLGGARTIHLALDLGQANDAHTKLRSLGVEVAILIEAGAETVGMVLLGRAKHGGPYTDLDLDFANATTSLAGTAVQNARLTGDLVAAERRATTGRVALAMAHDLGKELDWMGRLVHRLSKRLDDRRRLARDISMIEEFVDGVLAGLRRFVADSTLPESDVPGSARLDAVLEQAIQGAERRHGPGRIVESVAPNLRTIACHENLARVLANLLDNGLHAAPEAEPVQVFASVEDGWLRVEVIDSGPGIDPVLREHVFRPGFSTRRGEGGLGIGLTVSREIVESLGGSIGLEPGLGGGTRAVVRVPLREESGRTRV